MSTVFCSGLKVLPLEVYGTRCSGYGLVLNAPPRSGGSKPVLAFPSLSSDCLFLSIKISYSPSVATASPSCRRTAAPGSLISSPFAIEHAGRQVSTSATGSVLPEIPAKLPVCPDHLTENLTVGDVMASGDLVYAKPTTTIHEAMELLFENRITGMPVLDDDGKLVGVVSDYDLLALDEILALL
eukprot:TRINITY_DN2034_c0_g1_i8.p1 TRINITY_DN2034_c0_g1~~TRINITY_DN2034_c0_g1_i8.p1  ORF type:complete len:184 (+),score=20.31 TRINITY_DN2034_c0_g1_i8:98-649(+)